MMLRNIFFEFKISTFTTEQGRSLEILRSKRDYYRLDTHRLMNNLPFENNPNMEYFGSLIYKDLIIVGGYLYPTDESSLSNKKTFVIFKGKKILGVVETACSYCNKDEVNVDLSVFIQSINARELAMALEVTLPEMSGINTYKTRDKILEEITGLPTPNFIKMYSPNRIPFNI
jgi:hypothetical protein